MTNDFRQYMRPTHTRVWLAVSLILAVAAICGADAYLAIPA